MIYVVIDTNIYLSILHERNEHEYKILDELYGDIISNDIRGFEYKDEKKLPKSLINLSILCKNNIIKLLVPEVTLLELEKASLKFKEDYSCQFKKLKEIIKSHDIWNEINYIKKDLTKVIDTNEKIDIQNWQTSYNNLVKFLKEDYNTELKLNADIICSLYRKTISGAIKDRQSNDFLFLSSIYDYMKENYDVDTKLILVTNDKKDFFKKDKNCGFSELKDELKHDFIHIKGLEHINSLYKYIDSQVDLEKEINKVCDKYSDYLIRYEDEFPDYTWYDDWHSYDAAYSEVLQKFNEKNKSFNEIDNIRHDNISCIKEILSNCRNLASWNDKSELGLYDYLDGKLENELEILRLSELLIIRDNLKQYYNIHKEMDFKMPSFRELQL